jgi:hypothetical protein
MRAAVVSQDTSRSKKLAGILLKALAGRLSQLGREMEVVVSRNDGHVSQVGGQLRQFALHLDPLPIPAI